MGGWGMIRGLDESEGEQGKEERTKEGGKQNGNRKRSPSSSSSSLWLCLEDSRSCRLRCADVGIRIQFSSSWLIPFMSTLLVFAAEDPICSRCRTIIFGRLPD